MRIAIVFSVAAEALNTTEEQEIIITNARSKLIILFNIKISFYFKRLINFHTCIHNIILSDILQVFEVMRLL